MKRLLIRLFLSIALCGITCAQTPLPPAFPNYTAFKAYCISKDRPTDTSYEYPLIAGNIVEHGMKYLSRVIGSYYENLEPENRENVDNYVKSVSNWCVKLMQEFRIKGKFSEEEEMYQFIEILQLRSRSEERALLLKQASETCMKRILYTVGTPWQLVSWLKISELAERMGDVQLAISYLDQGIEIFEPWRKISGYFIAINYSIALEVRAGLCVRIGDHQKALESLDKFFAHGLETGTIDYDGPYAAKTLETMRELVAKLHLQTEYSQRLNDYGSKITALTNANIARGRSASAGDLREVWPLANDPTEAKTIGTFEEINARLLSNYRAAHENDGEATDTKN